MHRLLKRQLEQYIKDNGLQQQLDEFLEAIDTTYFQADEDRDLLVRSLEITSGELVDRNRDLKTQLSKQKDVEQELKLTLSLMRSTLDASLEAVLVVDPTGQPIVHNENLVHLWGLDSNTMHEVSAESVYLLIENHLKTPHLFLQQQQRTLSQGVSTSFIFELMDGRVIESDAIMDEEIGLIWSFRDITERHRQAERIKYQAHHDSLTGLPNRILLNDRIQHAIEKAKRRGGKMGVFCLDMDGFKKINDSLGHDAGDYVLLEIAKRFGSLIRGEDTVARIGGDEYVIVLEETSGHQDVICVAERVLRLFDLPVHYHSHELYTSTSIGIALYPDDGADAAILLKNADIALYKAKEEGRNRFHFFTPSLERLAQHRLSIETQLRSAVKEAQFEVYYQPEYNLGNGQLIGYEALLRWRFDGKFIPPNTFIPIAENTGIIIPLGNWVIEDVCKQLQQWKSAGHEDFYVAVNLSPMQFRNENLYEHIAAMLDKYEVPASSLAIEITESIVIDNVSSALDILNRLNALGVRICLDDFGTGYSSLKYLKSLPIDILKVDRSFIRDIAESKQNRAITSSIIALGHNLEQMVVAEGVEEEVQLNILKELGCDAVQGFLLARPAPPEELTTVSTFNESCRGSQDGARH